MASNRSTMEKTDVWQGTLALMALKTLETMGPLHGYGIARRIEQISGNRLAINYGTLSPARGKKAAREGSAPVGADDRYHRPFPLPRGGVMRALRALLFRLFGFFA